MDLRVVVPPPPSPGVCTEICKVGCMLRAEGLNHERSKTKKVVVPPVLAGATIQPSFPETSLLFVLILCYQGPCISRS
jgi:hypothetical protein